MPTPSILTTLRKATAKQHRALERISNAAAIMDGSLDVEGYRRLINWQARAHAHLEPYLEFAWDNYRYQSRQSVLPAYQPQTDDLRNLRWVADPDKATVALGFAYVLEGGSLGGTMILKHLRKNKSLHAHQPFPFYQHQAECGLRSWKKYVTLLASTDFSDAQTEEIVAGAQDAFTVFAHLWR